MNKLLIGAAALLLLTGCGQEPATEAATDKAPTLTSGVIHENMDLSVNPGEDFFSYVNGRWVADTEIPADRSDYGTFGVLRDEAQEHFRAEGASGLVEPADRLREVVHGEGARAPAVGLVPAFIGANKCVLA